MAGKGYTTIFLTVETKERLKQHKVHPRQSFNELIDKMLDYIESSKVTA